MTNETQEFVNRLKNKEKISYLDLSNQELSGDLNLANFVALTSLNAYKNNFTSLNFLFTIPNKTKLKKLNFWGNQITNLNEIIKVLNEFSNLESLNLGSNPLDWSNLNTLSDQQILSLIKGIEEGKIKLNSNSSELTLLKYIRQLKEENVLLKQQIQTQIEIIPK